MMVKDKSGGRTSSVSANIAIDGRFSDVTNTGVPPSSNRMKYIKNLHSTHLYNKGNSEQLHQEITSLKKLLAEKEAILDSQNCEMQKLFCKWYTTSQQNQQLAQTNGQMFGDLCMFREKLKLLEHDYNQMSAMFKFKRTELEVSALRRSNLGLFMASFFLRANGFAKEENTNGKRLCSRRGLANVSYGRPNLQKLRQEGQTVSAPTLCQNDQHNAAFSGLETLKKVCGGDICNKADSSSMTSGCAAEESANGTRYPKQDSQ